MSFSCRSASGLKRSLFLALAIFAIAPLLSVAAEPPVVLLWPNGAPGSEGQTGDEIILKTDHVTNIHRPSLTVFLPAKEQNTGAAIIIAPGGSHEFLWINYEGYAIARWFAEHGVAGFVLKYRLSKDASAPGGKSPYSIDVHERADAERALRVVRNRAAEWGVNPAAIGFLGISAGGEITLLATTRATTGKLDATDPVERASARPNFLALLYPGGLARTDIELPKDMPPVFLLGGYRDRPPVSEGLAEFYLKCKKAGVNAELHIYASAGHGFGLRDSNPPAVGAWPARVHDWLIDRKLITATAKP
jgi:acetyl esterase/lipase